MSYFLRFVRGWHLRVRYSKYRITTMAMLSYLLIEHHYYVYTFVIVFHLCSPKTQSTSSPHSPAKTSQASSPPSPPSSPTPPTPSIHPYPCPAAPSSTSARSSWPKTRGRIYLLPPTSLLQTTSALRSMKAASRPGNAPSTLRSFFSTGCRVKWSCRAIETSTSWR